MVNVVIHNINQSKTRPFFVHKYIYIVSSCSHFITVIDTIHPVRYLVLYLGVNTGYNKYQTVQIPVLFSHLIKIFILCTQMQFLKDGTRRAHT